jgi:hypothetical protein
LAGASGERSGVARRRAADERAQAMAPIVRELREAGIVTLRAMADELNRRNIKTARGGHWHPATVFNLLARLRRALKPMA